MPNFRCFRQRKNEKGGVAAAKIRFIGLQELPCVEEAFCFTHPIRIHPTVFIRLASPNFQSMPKRFEKRKAVLGLRYPNRVFLRGIAPQ